MVRYLGLDVSHSVTGWAVMSDPDTIIDSGHYVNKTKFEAHNLVSFGDWLHDLLKMYSITHTAIEDFNVFEFPNSVRVLAMYHGCAIYLMSKWGAEWEYVNVSTWKKAFGIKDDLDIKLMPAKNRTEARKEQYVDVVSAYFGIELDRKRERKTVGSVAKLLYQDRMAAIAIATTLARKHTHDYSGPVLRTTGL